MADEQWHWQEPGTAWKGIGIYHVTLVVSSREPLLGELVIPANDPTQARVELSELGLYVKACVDEIPKRHKQVRIIKLRMMPDHVHVILYVTQAMDVSIKMVVRGLWQGAKKAGREYSASISPMSKCPTSISPNNIRDNKRGKNADNDTTSISPNSIRDNERCQNGDEDAGKNQPYDPIFNEMPFIRPMSRRGQLQAMIRYVEMNPQRLATKRLMPGLFRVQHNIEIAGREYSGVGNIALLQSEQYRPVHVRRAMVEAAEHGEVQPLRDYMNSCVIAARHGTVMVSPFISPKEKEVMAVLLKENLLFIYLADNGFREYYKPQDNLFDAVAEGRVLILSPWEHDAEKKHISRADCVALNTMAEEICKGESMNE
ncbi:MAG: hypothetical protein IJS05_02440 [Paludibacteraceae bacterium]|nr:hypothetical protein [Paludibacteraceae bacterium]